jgi:hypothetical protein
MRSGANAVQIAVPIGDLAMTPNKYGTMLGRFILGGAHSNIIIRMPYLVPYLPARSNIMLSVEMVLELPLRQTTTTTTSSSTRSREVDAHAK